MAGAVYWTGGSIDPSHDAQPVNPPAPAPGTAPVPTPRPVRSVVPAFDPRRPCDQYFAILHQEDLLRARAAASQVNAIRGQGPTEDLAQIMFDMRELDFAQPQARLNAYRPAASKEDWEIDCRRRHRIGSGQCHTEPRSCSGKAECGQIGGAAAAESAFQTPTGAPMLAYHASRQTPSAQLDGATWRLVGG